jgi:glycyl-tRNA synthetase beta subunit
VENDFLRKELSIYLSNKDQIEQNIIDALETSEETNIHKANEKIKTLKNVLKSKSKDTKILKKV